MITKNEVFISVDVETSGPIPGEYSLLSIGACIIEEPEKTFECELKPTILKADPEALAVTGFTLAYLEQSGLEPMLAMRDFHGWILKHTQQSIPVFVGFNAAFDWSFINYYFHKYLGDNPFGFSPLDIKALYMGNTHCHWTQTKSSHMISALNPSLSNNHNALQDALF